MLYGVDVSEFQGVIDWDALNAVANFVIIRASFGTERTDNQFVYNQSEARRVQAAAGPLGIGYYYYAYPTLLDPVTSANYFVDNLGTLQEEEVLALDLEGAVGNDPVGWSLAWLNQVESRTTVKPLLYINQSLMNGHDWSAVISGNFGLWLADYDYNKTGPGVDTPWPVTAIRQWTDKDAVAGISGQVDGDVAYMDFAGFAAYGFKPVPVVPVIPSPPVVTDPVPPVTDIPTTPAPVTADPVPTVSVPTVTIVTHPTLGKEAPIDTFIHWLLDLIFFWKKGN